jgi:3-keto-5-aminohexanoate cleavage enzyme
MAVAKSKLTGSKVIINLAPTGMIPTKDMTPNVPVAAEEIANDVLQCRQYGAAVVHLHARGDSGQPTWLKDTYANIISQIREHDKDLVLTVSTSGRNWTEFEKRSQCLELKGDLKPDMASLTLSSLNFNKEASVNSPDTIKALASKMKENNIRPELEAFDIGMINYAKYLWRSGFIDPPFYVNLILGNIACAQANVLNLGLMLNELRDLGDVYWSVGGVGDCQLRMNVEAMLNGGGVRVGLEDNIYYDKERKRLATNIELVKRIYDIANYLGCEIATPTEVREMLGLGGVTQV